MPPFKEQVDRAAVERLGRALRAGGDFDANAFAADAARGIEALELKARVAHVAAALGRHLSAGFPEAAALVDRTIPPSTLGMWEVWPVTDWVAQAGIEQPEVALPLLARVTGKASAEFAIRPFIQRYPGMVRKALTRWVRDPDEEVRRLVSEGTRPRLPWAPRVPLLDERPDWAVPLLDRLREDPSASVRRSVANHLNDLCKAAPDLAREVATRWAAEGGAHAEAVLRHGLRTLVKAGDPLALDLVGAHTDAEIDVAAFELLTPVVTLGGELEWRCRLVGDRGREATVIVDYVVHFMGARGEPRPKVFKLRTARLAPGATLDIRRRHRLAPISTRRYYPGRHRVELQVNGRVRAGGDFELVIADDAVNVAP